MMFGCNLRNVVAGFLAVVAGAAAAAEMHVTGPVEATVLRVVDGDTISVRAHIWLGLEMETIVRFAGIDAPELHGHCEAEVDLAQKAKAYVEGRVASGQVQLRDIVRDKYGGRVLARVQASGADLSQDLLAAGLAHQYRGGRRLSWCEP